MLERFTVTNSVRFLFEVMELLEEEFKQNLQTFSKLEVVATKELFDELKQHKTILDNVNQLRKGHKLTEEQILFVFAEGACAWLHSKRFCHYSMLKR